MNQGGIPAGPVNVILNEFVDLSLATWSTVPNTSSVIREEHTFRYHFAFPT